MVVVVMVSLMCSLQRSFFLSVVLCSSVGDLWVCWRDSRWLIAVEPSDSVRIASFPHPCAFVLDSWSNRFDHVRSPQSVKKRSVCLADEEIPSIHTFICSRTASRLLALRREALASVRCFSFRAIWAKASSRMLFITSLSSKQANVNARLREGSTWLIVWQLIPFSRILFG